MRPSLFSGEQRYVLAGDELVISDTPKPKREGAAETKEQRIALADIRWLQLIYSPGRYDTNRFECLLAAEIGGKRVKRRITSMHFSGLADFVDQADTYTPFVRALCQRTAAQNPSVQVRAGYTRFAYYAGLLFFFLLIGSFVVFLIAEWTIVQRLPRTTMRLLLLGSLLVLLAAVYRKNRPRTLRADALPDELLPKPRA